jgi:lipid A 3-O-deacylase
MSTRQVANWPRGVLRLLAPCALSISLCSARASAESAGRLSLVEENDSFVAYQDKHYTQGLLASYVTPDLWDDSGWSPLFTPLDLLDQIWPSDLGHGERVRRIAIGLGQSLFTPADLHFSVPDPDDRPYAGWLYGDLRLLEEDEGHFLQCLELQLGMVGPAALGEEAQNSVHFVLSQPQGHGWLYQLHNEPGGVLAYDAAWRAPVFQAGLWTVDVIPAAGATAGNIFIYAAAGGLLRIGENLGVDYGPTRIRPAISGADFFNEQQATSAFGFYFFGSTQERLVARNIFLDGNSFESSARVQKNWQVLDLSAGASIYWVHSLRVDFVYTARQKEFQTQQAPDTFGNINLALQL